MSGERTWAVGDHLPPLDCGRISRTTLALFAGGSGDHNPIHLDIDTAHAAGMDDVFAQGMLSMAYLGRLITDNFPQHRLRGFTTRFAAITPVNAHPTCFGEITGSDGTSLTVDLRVELADGTRTLTGTATLALEGSTL
ncbi:MAG: dehydratase [Actinomycetota bacterium]|nr:dehydratase [Actinomycetota bacterium]